MERYKKFEGDEDTIFVTHVWGTGCNLSCDFCLNEGRDNLNESRHVNFLIADCLKEFNRQYSNVLYVEHGGELLYCDYLFDLFEYKTQHIENYRCLFFTNGTCFSRYKGMFDMFKDYIDPYLSFHYQYMTDKQLKEFQKCVEYTIELLGYCNIAFVYHSKMEYNSFKEHVDKYLLPYKQYIQIRLFIDHFIFGKPNVDRELIRSYKFLALFDKYKFKYKKLHKDMPSFKFTDKAKMWYTLSPQNFPRVKPMVAIEVIDSYVEFVPVTRKPIRLDLNKREDLERLKNALNNTIEIRCSFTIPKLQDFKRLLIAYL